MQIIPLTQGQITIVDDVDFKRFGHLSWYAKWSNETESFYAQRNVKRGSKWTTVTLHREIKNAPARVPVDHRNGDTLFNLRMNLRICTYSQNAQNRMTSSINSKSGFRGVVWRKSEKFWTAQIGFNGKQIHLGCFKKKSDAIAARIKGSAKYHKQFRGALR